MGLDSLWRIQKGKEYVEIELDEKDVAILEAHPLIGGMLSKHGQESFRGKCYSDLIQNLSGESLYQEYIKPERVQHIADKLNQTSHAQALSRMTRWPLDKREFRNLQVVFTVYAKYGAGLVGWW